MIKELNYKDIYLIPKKCIVESRSKCDTRVMLGKELFAMPVYPANMKSVVNESTCEYLANRGWFYTMHRFGTDNVNFTNTMHIKGLPASISIGLQDELSLLLKTKPEYITIDVANAWSNRTEYRIKYIKDALPSCYLIVGNVATDTAATDLEEWGADAIKVGIAGGHVCITKDKTGFARPMVNAILDCKDAVKIPIIADGGISTHGDIAKAVACGAHMVMAGMLFSGYDESAGTLIEIDNKHYKEYYGSASEHSKADKRNIEGKRILVEYKGSMDKLLTELKEDLQSAISYSGGDEVKSLRKVWMIRV